MTSAELKHRAKLQEWAARIQDCRSSGLSVRAWCRQEEINAYIIEMLHGIVRHATTGSIFTRSYIDTGKNKITNL